MDEEYSPFEQSQEAQEAISRVQGAYLEGIIEEDELEKRIGAILRDDEIDFNVRQGSQNGELEAMIEADIKRHIPISS